jgi:hypothetical protein
MRSDVRQGAPERGLKIVMKWIEARFAWTLALAPKGRWLWSLPARDAARSIRS